MHRVAGISPVPDRAAPQGGRPHHPLPTRAGAEAMQDTPLEAQMNARGTADVETVRVVEHPGIPVGGADQNGDVVAFPDRATNNAARLHLRAVSARGIPIPDLPKLRLQPVQRRTNPSAMRSFDRLSGLWANAPQD